MKIAMLHGPRDLRIEEHDLDTTLGLTQVHARTEISAFKIGTDRGNYEGAEPVAGAPDYPRWVGDSNLGVVEAESISAHGREYSLKLTLPPLAALVLQPESVTGNNAAGNET